jgi:alkylation response protein AidB-like acyl-CoA dehydrogenase
MDFLQNELTEQVAQSARDFANQHIRPKLMDWDESQEFPVSVFKELGKLGMMGVLVPEAYGGAGLGLFRVQCRNTGSGQSMRFYRIVCCRTQFSLHRSYYDFRK